MLVAQQSHTLPGRPCAQGLDRNPLSPPTRLLAARSNVSRAQVDVLPWAAESSNASSVADRRI